MGFFGGGGGTTPVNMVGASTGTAGTAGYVPAPAAGKNTRALLSDASFGELPLLPQYKNTQTNHYIGPFMGSISGGTLAPVAKSRRFILLYIPTDGQIDVLGIRTGTAFTSSINVHVALWECAEDGTPSTYVIGGTITTGTAGTTVVSVSVSATNVKRGFYFLSVTPETTDSTGQITAFSNPATFGLTASWLGCSNFPISAGNPNIFYYTATTYNQTTHESFTVGYPSGGPWAAAVQYV